MRAQPAQLAHAAIEFTKLLFTHLSPFDASSTTIRRRRCSRANWPTNSDTVAMIDRIATAVISVIVGILIWRAARCPSFHAPSLRGSSREQPRLHAACAQNGVAGERPDPLVGCGIFCRNLTLLQAPPQCRRSLSTTTGKARFRCYVLPFAGLTFWHMAVLDTCGAVKFRTPADMPKEHDPWCDICGYNLNGIEAQRPLPGMRQGDPGIHRCPCRAPPPHGKCIPPRLKFLVIARQESAPRIIRASPPAFFIRCPLRPARPPPVPLARLFAGGHLSVAAIPIVPAIYIVMDCRLGLCRVPEHACHVHRVDGVCVDDGRHRNRGHRHVLPHAGEHPRRRLLRCRRCQSHASYTAILMILWVILGGAQLVVYIYFSTVHDLFKIHHISWRLASNHPRRLPSHSPTSADCSGMN